jgi:hypothetical protein
MSILTLVQTLCQQTTNPEKHDIFSDRPEKGIAGKLPPSL